MLSNTTFLIKLDLSNLDVYKRQVLPVDLTGRPVLVVRAQGLSDENRSALRDYVVESLGLGVLVIGTGITYSLERFPSLGGVQCHGIECTESPDKLLREHSVDCVKITGRFAEEKQLILARLKAFRHKRGLGCFAELAKEAGSPVTDSMLRSMLVGAASPNIAQWRQVGTALDRLEPGKVVPTEK